MSETEWDETIGYREPYEGPGGGSGPPAEVWEESYTSLDHRVFITCDSVLSRRTRFSLYVKYGRPPRSVACPVCGRKARVELETELEQEAPDYEPGPGWVSRVWGHLAYPFKGGYGEYEPGEQP